MLRVTVVASAARAEAYYVTAAEYYHGEELLPARWHGKGAEMLGLHGEVACEHFSALCRNRNPFSGERITGADRENRRVAYDLTFSVSKSVSVQALLANDDRIIKAFRESVQETMQWVELDAAVRVRAAGKDEDRRVGNLIYADFYHGLTRPVGKDLLSEPHVHAHVICFMAYDPDERKWKALQADFKRFAPYHQAVFRAKLAAKIQCLGYEIEARNGDFEIKGVSQAIIDKFSGRTKEIEALASQLAKEKKVARLAAAVKARLGVTSRRNKNLDLTWEQFRDHWHARLTPEEVQAVHLTHEKARAGESQFQDRSPQAFDLALDHLLERKSVVSERELLAETFRRGVGYVTYDVVLSQLDRPELVRAVYEGTPMVSTRAVIAEEQELIAIARRGRDRLRPLAAPPFELVEALNAGQRFAVHHLLGSSDRFSLVRGKAGVGKSFLLKATVKAMEQQGVHVTVLAPTSSASRINLREEGIASAETLQRFLVDTKMQQQAAGNALILDEGSLAGIKDMLTLARLAEQKNIRVAILGDPRQHKAVSRGDVLTILEEFGGIRPAHVPEILRQSGEYKKTVELLSEGRVESAFDRLLQSGAIKEAGHEELAQSYVNYLQQNHSVTVVAPTHAEGSEVATAIRSQLKEHQLIGQQDRYFTRLVDLQTTEADRRDPGQDYNGMVAQFQRNRGAYKAGQRVIVTEVNQQQLREHASAYRLFRYDVLPIAENDRIRITVGGKSLCGRKLDAGRRFTVKKFSRDGDIITHNGVRISQDFQHLSQDYVNTSFQAQSSTSDAVLVAQSSQSFGASNAAQCYVSLSRARLTGQALVFTDDIEGLRKAVTREDAKPVASRKFRSPDRSQITRWLQRLRLARRRDQTRVQQRHPRDVQPTPQYHAR